MGKKENVVVGLDIGTTKTCTIVGEVKESGLDIIGVGSHPSEGLRKGVVVNIEDDVVLVQMDDGGVVGAPTQGVIPAIRMNGVNAIDDRVRVHFYPSGGAEAHKVEI